jgi:hypothetical protein
MNSIKIVNAFNQKVLTPQGWSREIGKGIVQFDDNGTADHIWSIAVVRDSVVKIVNQFNGLWIGVNAEGKVVQGKEEKDHFYWVIKQEGHPTHNSISARVFNKATNKALTPLNWSKENGGEIVVWSDEGHCHTKDHLWHFVNVPSTGSAVLNFNDWIHGIRNGSVALNGTLAASARNLFNTSTLDLFKAYGSTGTLSQKVFDEIAHATNQSVQDVQKKLSADTQLSKEVDAFFKTGPSLFKPFNF